MTPSKLETKTGAELIAEPFAPTKFIVNALIPPGLHILGGAPKIGKSWLTLGNDVRRKNSNISLCKCSGNVRLISSSCIPAPPIHVSNYGYEALRVIMRNKGIFLV